MELVFTTEILCFARFDWFVELEIIFHIHLRAKTRWWCAMFCENIRGGGILNITSVVHTKQLFTSASVNSDRIFTSKASL